MSRKRRSQSVAPKQPAAKKKRAASDPDAKRRALVASGLTLLTFVLTLPIFAPMSWWPIAHVAFVPWLIMLSQVKRSRTALALSYLLGCAFYLFHLRWLSYPTGAGYVAASVLYLAFYFPVFGWTIRHLHKRRNLCMTIVFPLAWVAQEFIRSNGPLAFPWFHLAHTQIRLLTMIQIADIGGAYLVSFLVAMINGWIADRIIWSIRHRKDRRLFAPWHIPVGGLTIVALLILTAVYGMYRLKTRDVAPGPRIAVLQGDFLLKTDPNDDWYSANETKKTTYLNMLAEAFKQEPRPELAVVPESAWFLTVNKELRDPPAGVDVKQGMTRRAIKHHAEILALIKLYNTPLLLSGASFEFQPADADFDYKGFNSAFYYTPGATEPGRYNKRHLVPFGEYVPFQQSETWRWLYHLLNDGPWNPWGQVDPKTRQWHWPSFPLSDWKPFGDGGYDYSQTPGTTFDIFSLNTASLPDRPARFGVTICYEDVTANIFREFILDDDGNKQVDFMLNISNDGWFGHGAQQAQHLASCAFRAIENRVPVARAANTGISGFVETDGSWHDLVTNGAGLQAGGEGYRIAQLQLDPRITFYSRYGNFFAVLCMIWAVGGLVDGLIVSVFKRFQKDSNN